MPRIIRNISKEKQQSSSSPILSNLFLYLFLWQPLRKSNEPFQPEKLRESFQWLINNNKYILLEIGLLTFCLECSSIRSFGTVHFQKSKRWNRKIVTPKCFLSILIYFSVKRRGGSFVIWNHKSFLANKYKNPSVTEKGFTHSDLKSNPVEENKKKKEDSRANSFESFSLSHEKNFGKKQPLSKRKSQFA